MVKKQRAKRQNVFGSFPYAFRLSGRPDEKPYAEQLEQWIENLRKEQPLMGRSQAMQQIVKGLIEKYIGRELVAPENKKSANLQTFRESLLDEVRGMVVDMLANPQAAARISEAAKAVANGEEIDTAIVDNIMADFVGRRK